jgi:hypothetical protein
MGRIEEAEAAYRAAIDAGDDLSLVQLADMLQGRRSTRAIPTSIGPVTLTASTTSTSGSSSPPSGRSHQFTLHAAISASGGSPLFVERVLAL